MTTELRAVLDTFDEAAWCAGTARLDERLALALPDGDVGAPDDKGFVKWLLAHAEDAPFGHGGKTKVDKTVRAAKRLVARDRVAVHGFDPAAILDDIARTLSPTRALEARLTDVIVYEKGGKFASHKDTPRADDLVGTLVVGLPIAHTGGGFVLNDGRKTETFDFGEVAAGTVPWVALFSDVDHAIEPVKSGARVTLVYALHRTERVRKDAAAAARGAALAAACRRLAPPSWPLMIACGRHIIAEPGAKQPQSASTLRGLDREIAEALVGAGYAVAVRACFAGVPTWDGEPAERTAFPSLENLWAISRLKTVPPASLVADMGDEGAASDMEDHLLDAVPLDRWVVRKTAAATLVHESANWSDTGYFGNEGYEALLYSLGALEVTSGAKTKAKAPAKTPEKPTAPAKPKAPATAPSKRKAPATAPSKRKTAR